MQCYSGPEILLLAADGVIDQQRLQPSSSEGR